MTAIPSGIIAVCSFIVFIVVISSNADFLLQHLSNHLDAPLTAAGPFDQQGILNHGSTLTMSGSGGFYKYRCKNFYCYNCPNWVWVNNSPCATCIAEGRDDRMHMSSSSLLANAGEIVVPHIREGILQHARMEVVASSRFDNVWTLRDEDSINPRDPVVTTMLGRH